MTEDRMSPRDAGRVLAAAALFDNRTVGAEDVAAWHNVLRDLDGKDALDAVGLHYRDSTERLMPAHVRRIVVEIRNERARLKPPPSRHIPSRFEQVPERGVTARRGGQLVRAAIADVLRHAAGNRPDRLALIDQELPQLPARPGEAA